MLLLLVLVQARRIGRLRRRVESLTRGEDGRSLDAILDAHMDKVLRMGREVDEMADRVATVEGSAGRAFQRVGLVRFNPFEDTGGNQSFAVALLDGKGDGFVLSSLHARAGTRVYAKVLTAGRSDATLSDEESRAVRQALDSAAGPGSD